jgi:hypothetical protein
VSAERHGAWVWQLCLDEAGRSGRPSTHIRKALTQPVKNLGIADGYSSLKLVPRLQLRKIEHRINEARPTSGREVTRFHIHNDSHRTGRLRTFHVGGCYDTPTDIDLYALTPLGHGEDPSA